MSDEARTRCTRPGCSFKPDHPIHTLPNYEAPSGLISHKYVAADERTQAASQAAGERSEAVRCGKCGSYLLQEGATHNCKPGDQAGERPYTADELDLLERGLEEMARNEHPTVRFKYNSPLSALRAIRQLRTQAAYGSGELRAKVEEAVLTTVTRDKFSAGDISEAVMRVLPPALSSGALPEIAYEAAELMADREDGINPRLSLESDSDVTIGVIVQQLRDADDGGAVVLLSNDDWQLIEAFLHKVARMADAFEKPVMQSNERSEND